MSIYGNYRELAIEKAPKQAALINKFLEMVPFLANMPMAPTSDGLQHLFEIVKSVTTPKAVDLDAPLPIINAETELGRTNVSQFGGIMTVGEDKVKTLNKTSEQYFDDRLRIIMPQTAQELEKSLLVNSFLAYANANSNSQTAGGTNTGNMYSMLCVNWIEGSIEGLYDPDGWGRGQVFDAAKISGGDLMLIKDKDGNDIPGYSSRIKSQMGVQLADERFVSAINNIDIVIDASEATGRKAIPTEEQIDDMIDNARGYDGGRPVIYCDTRTLIALNTYKGSALEMRVADDNFDRLIASWNGVALVATRNFGKTS